MQTITENKVLQNFVSPKICSNLKYAGFSARSTFFWKIYDNDVILDTLIFDIDDYYKEGNVLVDKIAPVKEILPAYTIKDIESFLPDFCVCKTNKMYQVSIDQIYNVEAASAPRLPDAFGLIMLEAIRKRVIDLVTINQDK